MSRLFLRAWIAGIALLLAFVVPSTAQDNAASITIDGQVSPSLRITLADLQKLTPTNVAISFATDRGPESANYTGALLWDVLAGTTLIHAPGKNARLRHIFLVSGRDGYVVALSLGEIDPTMEGKTVILAYRKDGQPTADGIRLIVPGDRHGGRAVNDVVRIDVQ